MSTTSPTQSLGGHMSNKKWEPPKDWESLTDLEKIERLREVLKQNTASQYQRISQLEQLVNNLMEHQHLEGKIVVPVNRYGNSGINSLLPSANVSNKYF